MKLVLIASNHKHIELARLLIGSKIGHSKAVYKRIGATAYLIGVDPIKVGFWTDEFLDRHPFRCNKIILDLDSAEIDLRMAIGTDIQFTFTQKGIVKAGTIYAVSANGFAHIRSGNNRVITDLDKVQICKDYLNRIGVEIIDNVLTRLDNV